MFPTKQKQAVTANEYPPITAGHATKPRWFIFPDELPNGEFRGYENRLDATKVRGAFVSGQNIRFRDSAQPNLREGFSPIGTELSNSTPVYRAWVFETRAGDVYEIKSYNGSLYYYLSGTSTDYALLKSGFTVNKEFGYGNIGESGGAFHTMFCNGTDAWYEWNGAHTVVNAVTLNTIQKTGGGTWSGLPVPFYTTGTRSVIINGIEFTYTGGEGTDTLTGVLPDPVASGIVAGNFVVQSPRLPTFRKFLPFSTTATGAFAIGETVTGGTSTQTAIVQRVGPDGTYIVVTGASGSFTPRETITGGTSGATAVLALSLDQTLGPPLASIIAAHLSRLHCWDATKGSVWKYSMLDDPYTWTVFGLDTSGGSKDIEFGGAGTAFGRLNQTILGYKKRGITSLDFVQSGQLTDVPRYTTLIQSDDKGTTLGAIGQRSTFSSPYGMISITVDGKMILLKAITQNDQPDYSIISDPIQPVFSMGDHSDASGICVDGVAWYSYKSSSTAGANDTVLTGDLRRKTVDAYGNIIPLRWDVPYIGWQVKDWTAISDGQGGADVHWHSSLNSNSYAVDPDQKVDNGGGFTAQIRTWAEMCGSPEIRKKTDAGFIEILLRTNSIVNATLLLDEEGYTQQIPKTMKGIDTENIFGTNVFNPFGASVFGSEKIGSNGAIDDRKRYRFYFELKPTFFFFNISLQLEADTENSDFELIRWGVHVSEYETLIPKALKI